MDKRIKVSIGAISICAIALALLVIVPSPMSRITLVISAPTFDNNTSIKEIVFDNEDSLILCQFTENNVTIDVDVDSVVHRISVVVYIDKQYASTQELAGANTQVYIIVKNPAESIIYEDWLDNEPGLIDDQGDVWQVRKRDTLTSDITLTEGEWTIITKYDVYA